jgi:hypothetical protein
MATAGPAIAFIHAKLHAEPPTSEQFTLRNVPYSCFQRIAELLDEYAAAWGGVTADVVGGMERKNSSGIIRKMQEKVARMEKQVAAAKELRGRMEYYHLWGFPYYKASYNAVADFDRDFNQPAKCGEEVEG